MARLQGRAPSDIHVAGKKTEASSLPSGKGWNQMQAYLGQITKPLPEVWECSGHRCLPGWVASPGGRNENGGGEARILTPGFGPHGPCECYSQSKLGFSKANQRTKLFQGTSLEARVNTLVSPMYSESGLFPIRRQLLLCALVHLPPALFNPTGVRIT